jgi:hypothetical protein
LGRSFYRDFLLIAIRRSSFFFTGRLEPGELANFNIQNLQLRDQKAILEVLGHLTTDRYPEKRAGSRGGGGGAAATGRGRHVPPLELEPFSEDWLVWYDDRRLCSYIDMLNCNGAFHGIMPPLERRARERAAPGPSSIRLLS